MKVDTGPSIRESGNDTVFPPHSDLDFRHLKCIAYALLTWVALARTVDRSRRSC